SRVGGGGRGSAAAGGACPQLRGRVFASSVIMAEAAAQGAGVGLLPVAMFTRELQQGELVQPFAIETAVGSYWLTSLRSKRLTAGMQAFKAWLAARARAGGGGRCVL